MSTFSKQASGYFVETYANLLLSIGYILVKEDHLSDNWCFLVISIVIDSDRGHCYVHLKKINLR